MERGSDGWSSQHSAWHGAGAQQMLAKMLELDGSTYYPAGWKTAVGWQVDAAGTIQDVLAEPSQTLPPSPVHVSASFCPWNSAGLSGMLLGEEAVWFEECSVGNLETGRVLALP